MTQGHTKTAAYNALPHVNTIGFTFLSLLLLVMMTWPAKAQEPSFSDGYAAYERGEFYQARMIWETLADAGDARALFNLGTIYSEGRGTPRNMALAEDYWIRAAGEGHVQAMHNLGLSHIARAGGLNVEMAEQEYQTAIAWLQEAVNGGFANSQYSLGKIYQYGLSVARNDELAVELFTLAANQGFANAQYNLGKAFRDGRGVDRDVERSVEYFQMAALQGHAGAQNRLATSFARGDGVEQDDVAALFWASLAADQGHARATENREALSARMTNTQIDEAAMRILDFTQSH